MERLFQCLALAKGDVLIVEGEADTFNTILHPLQANIIMNDLAVLMPPHVIDLHFPPSTIAFILRTEQSIIQFGKVSVRQALLDFILEPHQHIGLAVVYLCWAASSYLST